jgi:hypothetical protein
VPGVQGLQQQQQQQQQHQQQQQLQNGGYTHQPDQQQYPGYKQILQMPVSIRIVSVNRLV